MPVLRNKWTPLQIVITNGYTCSLFQVAKIARKTEITKKKVCRNARCTSFLFITIQICSFSLSCDLLKISLIYVFPASKNSSCKLIKQSNQPVHTPFCQFCTHLFILKAMARKAKSMKTLSFPKCRKRL